MFLLIGFTLLITSCHFQEQSQHNLVKAKVIYKDDDRRLLLNENEKVQLLGKSVAAMVYPGRIRKAPRDPGFYKISQTPAYIAYDICQEEKFSDQFVLGACTGFLISQDTLMTAGHCISEQFECDNVTWVFNRTNDNELISEEQVYECDEILETGINNSSYLDYTILKLKKPVKNAKPLTIERDTDLNIGNEVFTLGHPFGSPLIIADNAFITNNVSSYEVIESIAENVHEESFSYNINPSDYFMSDLDVFTGNSGSPVFNINNKVVGLVASGANDWLLNDNFCKESNVITEYSEETELILKLISIPYLEMNKK